MFQRAAKGGGKLRGVENIPQIRRKTPPKNVFGPPTYDTFPPLFGDSLSFSLKRKRHRPDQLQFLRPPKEVLESTLCSTFPPPNSRDTFAPPSAAVQVFLESRIREGL